MSQQVLQLPGGPLEVWRSGEGPTALVAHGCGYGGSYRNNTWLAQELPNHQVISVSRPGYGETPLLTATTFHDQAAMYIDVLDAFGVSPGGLRGGRDDAGRVVRCEAGRTRRFLTGRALGYIEIGRAHV